MANRRKLNDFLNGLKGVPPRVQNRTPSITNSILNEEIAKELFVEDVQVKRKGMKDTAYDLWRLLEDIEKANKHIEDDKAYRELVMQLAEKRFLYINNEEVRSMETERLVRSEGEKNGEPRTRTDGTESN